MAKFHHPSEPQGYFTAIMSDILRLRWKRQNVMGTLQRLALQRPPLIYLEILWRKVLENFTIWIFRVSLSLVRYYANTALGKVMRRGNYELKNLGNRFSSPLVVFHWECLKWEYAYKVASNILNMSFSWYFYCVVSVTVFHWNKLSLIMSLIFLINSWFNSWADMSLLWKCGW